MDMVERVARALCKADGKNPDALEPGDAFGTDGHMRNGDPAHSLWREWNERAVAAIEAMREPTDEMIEAGVTADFGKNLGERVTFAHQAMINAALQKETPAG